MTSKVILIRVKSFNDVSIYDWLIVFNYVPIKSFKYIELHIEELSNCYFTYNTNGDKRDISE